MIIFHHSVKWQPLKFGGEDLQDQVASSFEELGSQSAKAGEVVELKSDPMLNKLIAVSCISL
jgi:hypothetical protein